MIYATNILHFFHICKQKHEKCKKIQWKTIAKSRKWWEMSIKTLFNLLICLYR